MDAPRRPSSLLKCCVRGARDAFCALLALSAPVAAAEICTEGTLDIAQVCFGNETRAAPYGHGVLGNTPEWLHLDVYRAKTADAGPIRYSLPRHVFEDIAPRLSDLDQDGRDEIIAVQSSFSKGARLAIFGLDDGDGVRLIAATPYIGTRNRWLAPIGAIDLDGDGYVELSFIDRPHLARTLRVWRFRDRRLEPVAALGGLTNHRIGEPFITGGVRSCGGSPEIITADARWSVVVATSLADGELKTRSLAPFDMNAIDAALNCR